MHLRSPAKHGPPSRTRRYYSTGFTMSCALKEWLNLIYKFGYVMCCVEILPKVDGLIRSTTNFLFSTMPGRKLLCQLFSSILTLGFLRVEDAPCQGIGNAFLTCWAAQIVSWRVKVPGCSSSRFPCAKVKLVIECNWNIDQNWSKLGPAGVQVKRRSLSFLSWTWQCVQLKPPATITVHRHKATHRP